jgi:predicted nucleic acid-binding protein
MADYQSTHVVDTSILIDLHIGSIIVQFFQLPYTFVTPDVILAELLEPRGDFLVSLGLEQKELASEQVVEVFQLRSFYRKPSVNDLFALVLARLLKASLLTNDKHLRKAASQEEIACHGSLWVLDEMVERNIILLSEATEALKCMCEKGSRLPLDEYNKRLKQWADLT